MIEIEKDGVKYNLTKSGNLINDTHKSCTSCGDIYKYNKESSYLCAKCNSERLNLYRNRDKSIGNTLINNNSIIIDGIEFSKNREGLLISDSHRQCTNCKKIFIISSKNMSICKECNNKRIKSSSLQSRMFFRAKSRAKKDNIEFNISIDDIIIPAICPILEIPLIKFTGKSGGRKNSPSLDRINPNFGYIKGNIMVISHLANQMKSNANIEELIKFSH